MLLVAKLIALIITEVVILTAQGLGYRGFEEKLISSVRKIHQALHLEVAWRNSS
jgi:hypothetical protein